MHLQPDGHPIHTRALSVVLTAGDDGRVNLFGSLLDLRKRGFVPVGSELQGMGIIHHMEVRAIIDPQSLRLVEVSAGQPTVAFEASVATGGESCRDVVGAVAALAGTQLGEGFSGSLRQHTAGPLGCSHLVALLQFAAASAPWAIKQGCDAFGSVAGFEGGATLFRRDLIIDGYETAGGGMSVLLQLGDLLHSPGPRLRLPADLLYRQDEVRVALDLDGWPAQIRAAQGGRRQRVRDSFEGAEWSGYDTQLAAVRGLSLGKGSTTAINDAFGAEAPLRDSLLMVGPALIQCRAAFPDKWLNPVVCTPQHPGLIGLTDSCYMWRRGGGLEQVRDALAAPRDRKP